METEDKGLASKLPTVWEAEVASNNGYSKKFHNFVLRIIPLARANNGGIVHQFSTRTFPNGKKDRYPDSNYFSFKTMEDAMNFRQSAISWLENKHLADNYCPVSGIWVREKNDIGSIVY
jgi:hypothetical protein